MRDLVILAALAGSLPLILWRPFYGIVLWFVVGIMNPHMLAYGSTATKPWAMMIFALMIISMVVHKTRLQMPWTRESITLLLFVFWMFLTTTVAVHPELAWNQWSKVWKIHLVNFIFMAMIAGMPGTLKEVMDKIQMVVWALAMSIGFYGTKGGLFVLMTGGSHRVNGPDRTFIAGNNELGLAMVMSVPLLRYLQLNAANKWVRRVLGGIMALSLFAILGTHSRGALVGIVPVLGYMWMKSRNKFFFLIFLGVIFPVVVQFMPQEWLDRMDTIQSYEEDGSALGRINSWTMAFNLANDRFMGAGFEAFLADMFLLYAPHPEDPHDAHSIWFEILGEHGWVGLALFFSIGTMAFFGAGWVKKQVAANPQVLDSRMGDLAAMLQVSILGYAASGSFLGLGYFDYYYAMVALVVILKFLVMRHLEIYQRTGISPMAQENGGDGGGPDSEPIPDMPARKRRTFGNILTRSETSAQRGFGPAMDTISEQERRAAQEKENTASGGRRGFGHALSREPGQGDRGKFEQDLPKEGHDRRRDRVEVDLPEDVASRRRGRFEQDLPRESTQGRPRGFGPALPGEPDKPE